MLGGIKGGMGAVRERASLQPRLSLPLFLLGFALHCTLLLPFCTQVCSTLNCTALCTSYLIQELFNRAFGFALHCTLYKSCSAFYALLHNRASLSLLLSARFCTTLRGTAVYTARCKPAQCKIIQKHPLCIAESAIHFALHCTLHKSCSAFCATLHILY